MSSPSATQAKKQMRKTIKKIIKIKTPEVVPPISTSDWDSCDASDDGTWNRSDGESDGDSCDGANDGVTDPSDEERSDDDEQENEALRQHKPGRIWAQGAFNELKASKKLAAQWEEIREYCARSGRDFDQYGSIDWPACYSRQQRAMKRVAEGDATYDDYNQDWTKIKSSTTKKAPADHERQRISKASEATQKKRADKAIKDEAYANEGYAVYPTVTKENNSQTAKNDYHRAQRGRREIESGKRTLADFNADWSVKKGAKNHRNSSLNPRPANVDIDREAHAALVAENAEMKKEMAEMRAQIKMLMEKAE